MQLYKYYYFYNIVIGLGKPAAYNETDKVNWIPTLFLDENQQITEYDDVDLQATGTANTTGQYLMKGFFFLNFLFYKLTNSYLLKSRTKNT